MTEQIVNYLLSELGFIATRELINVLKSDDPIRKEILRRFK